jgi:hypothetical protein
MKELAREISRFIFFLLLVAGWTYFVLLLALTG